VLRSVFAATERFFGSQDFGARCIVAAREIFSVLFSRAPKCVPVAVSLCGLLSVQPLRESLVASVSTLTGALVRCAEGCSGVAGGVRRKGC
jgi:hypothetical protein